MAKQTFTTGQVLTAAQMTNLQQTAMGGGSTTAKTTSYTLVAADAGTVVQMNSASATTITVNTALFAAGDTVQIQNMGAGVCTVTAGTATVSTSATLALKQYDAGTLYFNTTSAAIFFAVDAADGMTNPFTTTGDTVYASGGTTPTRLGIGSTGQVLTVASGIPSWATPSSGAKIVQVVTATTTTETGNSTSTYADTTLTASITPTSASNTILVIASHNGVGRTATSSASNVNIELFRGASEIAKSLYIGETNTALRVYVGTTVITKMDSPATTSATTYKTQFMNDGNAAAAYVQLGSSTSTIVLMEVAP